MEKGNRTERPCFDFGNLSPRTTPLIQPPADVPLTEIPLVPPPGEMRNETTTLPDSPAPFTQLRMRLFPDRMVFFTCDVVGFAGSSAPPADELEAAPAGFGGGVPIFFSSAFGSTLGGFFFAAAAFAASRRAA